MRGRILEVPSLLDYTVLREPRRRVAGLADVNRDGYGWSGKECYSAGVPRKREASRLQQCKRHRSVAPVQDGTERCAMVGDAGVVAAAQRSKGDHLSAAEGASTSRVFLV